MLPEMIADTLRVVENEFDKEPLKNIGLFAKGFVLSSLDKRIPFFIKYFTYTVYGLDGMLDEKEQELYREAQEAYKNLMEKLDKLTPLT